MTKLKVLSLFSGIGAFEKALSNIGVNYELYGFCEIDKYAVNSYCAVHQVDPSLNLGDITKIDVASLPTDIELITHGSPCQDYSVAGVQRGGDKGSNTRSSLMWYSVEIIKHCKPKYVIWENVKNVLSVKHVHNFEQYVKDLKDLGYTSYYKVLNAKDFGVPQNRERIYCISILGEHEKFVWPKPIPTRPIEEYIDEELFLDEFKLSQHYIDRAKSKSLTQGKFLENTMKLSNGEVQEFRIANYRYDEGYRVAKDNICPCLVARGSKRISGAPIINNHGQLRYIMPVECWRLMGFTDDDFYRAENVSTSETQLYKQAGNSIVVNVLEEIFKNLFGIRKEQVHKLF